MTTDNGQKTWETPRNIALLVGTAVVLTAALVGWAATYRQPPPYPTTLHIVITRG